MIYINAVCDTIMYFNVLQNATAQAALQAASAVMGGPTEEGQKRTTLRIIVEHLVYPVGIEVLYQVSQGTSQQGSHLPALCSFPRSILNHCLAVVSQSKIGYIEANYFEKF